VKIREKRLGDLGVSAVKTVEFYRM